MTVRALCQLEGNDQANLCVAGQVEKLKAAESQIMLLTKKLGQQIELDLPVKRKLIHQLIYAEYRLAVLLGTPSFLIHGQGNVVRIWI